MPLASQKPQRTPDGVLTREAMEQVIKSGRSFQFNRRTITRLDDIPGDDELVEVGAQTEDAAFARLAAQETRLAAERERVERRLQRQQTQRQRQPVSPSQPSRQADESLALPPLERDPEAERVGQPGSQMAPRGQQAMTPERPFPEGQQAERHPVPVAGQPWAVPGQPSDPERQPDQPGTRQPDPGPAQAEREQPTSSSKPEAGRQADGGAQKGKGR
jgi:hypothetical protein